MIFKNEITGVVLAGGKSSRFGENKALSRIGDKNFLSHIIDLLKPFSKEVLISGSYPEYNKLQERIIEDEKPGLGPVGGIYSALKNSSTEKIIVLTCDMPLVTTEIISYMLSGNFNADVIGWNHDGNRGQFPLLVSKKILPLLEANIEQNRLSVKQIFKHESSLQLKIPEEWKSCFANVNTMQDYREINVL